MVEVAASGRTRIPWRAAIGLTGLACLVAAALIAGHRMAPKHWRAVEPGVLYRSGWLPPEQLAAVVERHGIRTVVNLRSQRENEQGDWHSREAAVLAAAGVRLVDLPMHSGHPPDDATLASWLALIDDPASQPILVHCQYGVIRTGMLVAVWEMERRGVDNRRAWADFAWFGHEPGIEVRTRMARFVAGYAASGDGG